MRRLLLFVASCAGSSSHPPPQVNEAIITVRIDQIEALIDKVEAPARPYSGEIRSVRFTTTTALRKQPDTMAAKVGVIRKGTRVVATGSAPASPGCRTRWIQISPRGWACETVLVPTTEMPSVVTNATASDPPVRGVYGVVRGKEVQAYASASEAKAGTGRILTGQNSVRAAGAVTIDGRRFWRTSEGELIDAKAIARFSPSKFEGVVIEPGAKLPTWLRSHRDPYEPVTTFKQHGGKATGTLPRRMVVELLEESGTRVRVTETAWVARADVRVATLAAPPPGTRSDEKWFDVDLDEQVLVAYEGKRPVFATLVSTGKRRHYTPTVITRILTKHERADMTSDRDDIYSVADVPWTMYYDGNYALHTSYWHDGFGGPRSHGCINLAPRDARRLYHWSSPDVPPGWVTVYGDTDTPGSLVRVRSSRNPEPGFRGYARTLHERAPLVAARR
jgi:hypothetical protein